MFDKILSFSNMTLSNLVLLLLLTCGICLSLAYIAVRNNSNLIQQINEENKELRNLIEKINTKLVEIETKLSILTVFLPSKSNKFYKKEHIPEDTENGS